MRAIRILAVFLPALGLGCSDSDRDEAVNEEAHATPAPSTPPPVPAPESPAEGESKAPPQAEEEDPWEVGDAAPPADPEAPPSVPSAAAGPCTIRWSNGPILRFTYSGTGGTVRLDHDHDGKAETCATFELEGARLQQLELDEACDGKATSSLTPSYDSELNLATAKPGGKGPEITIVTLPSFAGLEPGYTLYAKRSAIKISSKDKLVRKARVTRPSEGAPLEATFTYDDAGRITAIDEDLDLDRTIDRKLSYAYDEEGRMSRMEVTLGAQGDPQKSTARIDYTCDDDAARP